MLAVSSVADAYVVQLEAAFETNNFRDVYDASHSEFRQGLSFEAYRLALLDQHVLRQVFERPSKTLFSHCEFIGESALATGVLGYWGTGVLGYWGTGVLGYWGN